MSLTSLYDVVLTHGLGCRFIDEVVEIVTFPPSVIARGHYTGDERLDLADHFPGTPLLLGVLLVEAMAETADQIAQVDPALAGQIAVLTGIRRAKFSGMVAPGAIITYSATVCREYGDTKGYAVCEARVAGRRVAEATIEFEIIPPETFNRLYRLACRQAAR